MNLFQVDAFTDVPFAGNPAAVCVLEWFPSDEWLQNFACEMNLSETAYLHPIDDGYALRWFTPGGEVDLCGHATLASAHVLWTEGFVDAETDTILFETRSGNLFAHREGTVGESFMLRLDFPATPPEATSPPNGLLAALGTTADYVGRSKFDFVVELENAAAVRELTPDFAALARVDARGVMVTSRGDDGRYDFVSRFFCPGMNIDEDPVTGSAHCCLAPFWAERLGQKEFTAFQASKRGGELIVRLVDDRVHLLGKAVTIFRGNLVVKLSRG